MNQYKDFNSGQIINLLTEKRFRFLRHAVFLVVFFFLLYNTEGFKEFPLPTAYYVLFTIYFTFIVMFYINMYVLVTFFLFKSRYVLYVLLLVLLTYLGLEVLGFLFENYFEPYRITNLHTQHIQNYYGILIICASLILISTTIKLLQHWVRDKERITELKNLTHTMELNELKNQVSPHFLFNMLNNVKALIRTNPEMATTVIMKLSEFLRYQLYENNGTKTLLMSEIEFVQNFLNLEKIRKDNLTIYFENHIDKVQQNSIFIPPGLFTVFVENAIKHSVSTNEDETYIKIELKIENQKLYFNCSNSISTNILSIDDKNGGLGLANIKRRLELLYGNQHKLDIISTDNKYVVKLIIPL